MKKTVKIVVVVPVGPSTDAVDTIESILFYMDSAHILAIDDSKKESARRYLDSVDPERLTVLDSKSKGGFTGGLWTSMARTYKYAFEHFEFKVLLKMDTDALIIAAGSEDEATKAFEQNPTIGMLGSYKVDCNGDPRDFKPAVDGVMKEYSPRGLVDMKRYMLVRKWVKLAEQHGYHIGDHILGGACFISHACIKAMAEGGFLDTTALVSSAMPEDFIWSLLTVTCGYELGDFATGDLPMGVRWRGLPDSPENLLKRNKKIIHSIRFWKDMNEESIRTFFAEQRATEKTHRH